VLVHTKHTWYCFERPEFLTPPVSPTTWMDPCAHADFAMHNAMEAGIMGAWVRAGDLRFPPEDTYGRVTGWGRCAPLHAVRWELLDELGAAMPSPGR
jgi:hypothetical protein